jgi:hypothetical protein
MEVSNWVYAPAVLSSEEISCWIEGWVGSQSCLLGGEGKKEPHSPAWNVNLCCPVGSQSPLIRVCK